MEEFFSGQPVILNGRLRILPHAAFANQVKGTVSATEQLLCPADDHIKAGRLPVLKDATRQGLLEKAHQWEINQYGRPLRQEPAKPAGGQKSLFE